MRGGAHDDACTIVDERVDHEGEELGHELEGALLGAGSCLARQMGKRSVEVAATEPKQADKVRRQLTAGVEEIVERGRDLLLVAAELPVPGPSVAVMARITSVAV